MENDRNARCNEKSNTELLRASLNSGIGVPRIGFGRVVMSAAKGKKLPDPIPSSLEKVNGGRTKKSASTYRRYDRLLAVDDPTLPTVIVLTKPRGRHASYMPAFRIQLTARGSLFFPVDVLNVIDRLGLSPDDVSVAEIKLTFDLPPRFLTSLQCANWGASGRSSDASTKRYFGTRRSSRERVHQKEDESEFLAARFERILRRPALRGLGIHWLHHLWDPTWVQSLRRDLRFLQCDPEWEDETASRCREVIREQGLAQLLRGLRPASRRVLLTRLVPAEVDGIVGALLDYLESVVVRRPKLPLRLLSLTDGKVS